MEGVVEAFNHTIHPAGGYRIYETIHLDADGFVLEGIPFHTGHKIAHALRGSSSLAVVSITLGEDISRLIEQYNKEFDFITAYFNEYNQELTMIKRAASPNAKSVISHLDEYNFTLPIKHLDWTHNLVLIKQVKDIRARYWYMVQSITNHWTTRYLQEAIKLDDYGKHGALANNFTETLPVPEANDVKLMLKDPYIFDMLTFTEQYGDNRTIGLLLCKSKDRIKAEYALRDIQKPIGISDYELGQVLPKDFRGSLPTIEEIEKEFESD